ncbi:tripartite tricarboxylate transporter TctB family protein [Cellulosimicrobium cellulans]|uniref:tripartite tricarboxylate transporter TctB family protein n=1 Tax=Cellulosimicrobium cellulans TaxID=1710 RepID=UPI001BA891D3|nr:tripartite tricarboxylate transporter TctB family protein [Cellulosimicrobium cellulans]QUB98757.1 tripartite tricarboxylate transporter TctB family protein [Cellulosimicrobium cellulans]
MTRRRASRDAPPDASREPGTPEAPSAGSSAAAPEPGPSDAEPRPGPAPATAVGDPADGPAAGDPAGATPAAGPRRRPGELVVAGVTAALGVFVLLDAGTIVVPGSANTLGPRAFPYLVGALLLATGLVLLVAVWRGHGGQEEDSEDVDPDARTDWLTVGLLGAVLFVHVYAINLVGWPLAATLLFAGAAIVLGARPWWRAAVLGLVLALVIQVLFGGVLGLSLPPGPLLEGVTWFRG